MGSEEGGFIQAKLYASREEMENLVLDEKKPSNGKFHPLSIPSSTKEDPLNSPSSNKSPNFSDNSYLEPPSYADVIFSPFGPSSENGGFGEESINGGIVRMEHLISPNPFLISLMTRSSSTVLPPVHLFQLVIAAKLILLQVRMSTC